MAFVHGKSGFFSVDNSSGTPTDLSAFLNDVSLPRDIETAETTTFGVSGSAKTYIVGLTDATISVSGLFDSSADGTLAGVVGHASSLSFVVGPEGNGSGKVKYEGECFLTSYEISTSVGDAVQASASFQVSGAITRTTFA